MIGELSEAPFDALVMYAMYIFSRRALFWLLVKSLYYHLTSIKATVYTLYCTWMLDHSKISNCWFSSSMQCANTILDGKNSILQTSRLLDATPVCLYIWSLTQLVSTDKIPYSNAQKLLVHALHESHHLKQDLVPCRSLHHFHSARFSEVGLTLHTKLNLFCIAISNCIWNFNINAATIEV